MLFVSPIFLFLFLPIAIAGYYLLKFNRAVQNAYLFVLSILFYAWGEPKFSLALLCSVFVNWAVALVISKNREGNLKKGLLIFAIAANIGLLFAYKYLDFTIGQINAVAKTNIPLKGILLPIGISFFTFQALSYVIDVYRGLDAQRNPLYVGLYISFFPQLIAGPIVRYNSIAEQINGRVETTEKIKIGVVRFMQGFAKKVLLANTMAVIADKAFDSLSEELTMSFAWLGAIAYMFQIYFDFSGYSDMAIGLGKLFGFEFEENFNLPYISKSVTEFWRRWHISLSTWFRDYVYIPLGGNRSESKARVFFNLFVVWLLTGIWHGANWTFIAWGLLYFVILVFERATAAKTFFESHVIVGHVYSLFIILIAWVLFRSNSISAAAVYLKTMFDFSNFYSPTSFVYLKENAVFLAFAILCSAGITQKLQKRFETNTILKLISQAILVILFVVSVSYMVNGTYNPFIYFNF